MDIETDSAFDYNIMARMGRSDGNSALSPDMEFSKRMNSLSLQEDRVDSGLSSMGYVSEELNMDNTKSATESVNKSVSSLELEKSISNLNIDNSSDRCDSGINVDECKSIPEEQSQEDNRVLPPPPPSTLSSSSSSSHFSIEQIDEIFRGDEEGDNHLHLSIIHGLKAVTMQIISLAPDWDWLNQANNLLQTPLHIAVITRQAIVVRRLMCAGASIDVRDQLGNTPLHNACRLGFDDIVHVLLTPIRFEETRYNSYSIPFQRVPVAQDLDSRNYEGLTCLHLAAIGGHINVMNLLLASGASVNASEGKNGRTVLHMAADWGHMEMLQFLLKRRETNIDAFTYAGLTPIHLAYGRHHGEAVQVLLSFGASYDMQLQSDDSDMDNSDEESFDTSSSRLISHANIQHSYLQTCR